MHLSDYQAKALKTYKVREHHNPIERMARLTLGLCGESGELAEKMKKVMRGDRELGEVIPEMEKELGDVLWYCATIAFELLTNLDRVAALNIEKLDSRDRRGVIKGSGDER
jgi:NTP pyrophosphatase (non-canonical NTP hydrolase)